jgi:hypothetical protein
MGASPSAERITSAGDFFDDFNGNILGLATFDSALSDGEIMAHENAITSVPEPGSLAMVMGSGALLCASRRLRRCRKKFSSSLIQ